MLIRPPVVRDLRRNLWAGMTAKPEDFTPPPGPGAGADQHPDTDDQRLAHLKELGELKASGVLSDEEFATEKARILG